MLRLVSKKTKSLDLGDGGRLDVVEQVSRRDFDTLIQKMPDNLEAETVSPGQATAFTSAIFTMLVRGWNAEDEDGNPVPATVDNYLSLPREISQAVDNALLEYFNSLTPNREEQSKSEGPSAGNSEGESNGQPQEAVSGDSESV